MKFIHMSDIHFTRPGEEMEGIDPHQRFDLALKHCEAQHPDAARIVITGDLAHWGETGAYQALKNRIEASRLPIRLLLGNHDDRSNFLGVFGEHPRDANGYINHQETVGEFQFIYCDTNEPGTHAGYFGPDRLATLGRMLEEATRPVVLFMHHNPVPTGIVPVDKIGLIYPDSKAITDLLRAHRAKVRHIFFGHIHMAVSGVVAGIPYSAVRSTVHQALPDFSEPEWLLGGQFEPNYSVVTLKGDMTNIIHVPFAYDGPVRRSGTAWNDWAKPEAMEA